MKKSKYVESWFITKDPNNVYTLIINKTQRYCYHHHFGDDEKYLMFQISDKIDEEGVILEIPKFLPEIEGTWLESSAVIKDQIHYYFIPYLWEWIKNEDRIILKSE